MLPYVLKMEPVLQSRVWGGRALETLGRTLPDDLPYGESWEVADLPEGTSKVANGPLAGRSLAEVRQLWGKDLVGEHRVFPLLVKYLHAADDLSVQVHPGFRNLESLAEMFGEGVHSKDEAWLILDAEPGASILWGVKSRITRENLEAGLRDGTVVDLLRRIEVKAGDVFRVPPGTIHAICAGVLLLEIQEPSDTTYRLFDYNRPGLDGKPRPLHIEQAVHVSQLFPEDPIEVRCGVSDSLTDSSSTTLVDSLRYRIERHHVDAPREVHFKDPGPHVVVVLDGHLIVDDVELDTHDVAIIPASATGIVISGESTFVLCAARA